MKKTINKKAVKKTNNKISKKLLTVTLGLVILGGVSGAALFNKSQASNQQITTTASVGKLTNVITAQGDVEAENQSVLNFLAPGRVAYLGVKNGDNVYQGQVLANLDTTIASHNVSAADAGYRAAQAALNKVIDDIHLKEAGGDPAKFSSIHETQTEQTQRQQAEEAVNAAYDNLQSAQQNLNLQSIIAPFDGKVLSIQNIEPGTNVSPTSGSSITVIGGGNLKFVASVTQQDLNSVIIGQPVSIKLDSNPNQVLSGTITKIADSKTTLQTGESVIKVEIESDNLQQDATAGQTGSIEIKVSNGGILVPSWMIMGGKYIWVMENNKSILKEVKVGETLNGKTEILSGLSNNDQLILDPKIIAKKNYKII